MQGSNNAFDSDTEPNIMEAIRNSANELRELLHRIESQIDEQHEHARATQDIGEMQRLQDADPYRWLADAKHNLQAGIMFAERAVAQSTMF